MPQAIAGAIITAFGVGATSTAALLITSAVQLASGLLLSAIFAPDVPDAPGPQDGRENFTDATGPRQVWYGRNLVGGQVTFGRSRDGFLHRVFVHGHGEIDRLVELRIAGRQYQLEDDGRVLDRPYLHGENGSLIRIDTRLGAAPGVAYTGPTEGAPEWGAAHRGDGLWTTYMRCQQRPAASQQESYPNGAPSLQWIADGRRVFDPRIAERVYTDNAALVIADWLTHPDGFNLDEPLDSGDLIRAANLADRPRQLASGGTSRMWRLAGSASLAERPETALVRMLESCAGELRMRPDGKVSLVVGGDPEPVITLTDDDVLEFMEGDDGPDALDRYTELPITYVDEQLDYTETTADPWVDFAGEARLGEAVIAGPLDLRYAPYHAQARHAGKIKTARQNSVARRTIRYKISALPAIYESTVTLDHATLDLTGTWRVEPYTVSMSDLSVTLRLVQVAPDLRDWSVAEEGLPQVLPPQPPDDNNPPSPATGVQAFGNGFDVTPGVFVAYDAPVSPDTTHYVAFRRSGEADWMAVAGSPSATGVQISGLEDATGYDVAIIAARRESYDPAATDVTDVRILGVQSRSDEPVPVAPTAFAVADATGGTATITFTASASVFGRWTEIIENDVVVARLRTTPGQAVTYPRLSGAGAFTFAARAVSLADVAGGVTATLTRTIT